MSYDDAKAKLTDWQLLQENLEGMIQKEKIKTKTLGAGLFGDVAFVVWRTNLGLRVMWHHSLYVMQELLWKAERRCLGKS